MRIISQFRDYYDGASAYFLDQNIYIRKSEYHDDFRNIDKTTMIPIITPTVNSERIGVVGFCGTLYPFYTIETRGNDYFSIRKIKTVYTPEEVISYYKKSGYNYHKFESSVHNFFSEMPNNEEIKKLFKEFNTPIFAYYGNRSDKRRLSVNPILRTFSQSMSHKYNKYGEMFFDFHDIMDPFSASQNIDSYICNELACEKEVPVEVSDVVKAAKYGHDGKYSFKKVPSKH